jgi:hypothetical protein
MSIQISRIVFAALFALPVSCRAIAAPTDPAVPPGIESGGTPVALICVGIDYTREHVAKMLARDGEGEIIGYDFVDDDRRPFSTKTLDNKSGIMDVSEVILAEGQAATIVPIRANLDDLPSLVKAIGYAAQGPAKIIAIEKPLMGDAFIAAMTAASKRFPDHLFVVPVGFVETSTDGLATEGVANVDLPSVILSTGSTSEGQLHTVPPDLHFRQSCMGEPCPAVADVAIPTDTRFLPDTDTDNDNVYLSPSSVAFARTAALAARLSAVEPQLDGAAMKARILGLAKPLPGNPERKTRAGWIAEPWRHFWLE